MQDPAENACDDTSVEPGVWRFALATRVRVIVDAADYFELIQQAMLRARCRLLLIGWDFDTRIHLTQGRRWWQRAWKKQFPARLGAFLVWLTRNNPNLEIHVLKWAVGAMKFAFRGSMMFDLVSWMAHPRIDFKFDSVHPFGCSHHQKIVIIDDSLAVCGGIDITDRRWDTREHRVPEKRRQRPGGKAYGPWHDLTMMMEGPIAATLDELGRDRWRKAGGKPLKKLPPSEETAWPDELPAHFENVEVGIARTRPEYAGQSKIDEVEKLFVEQIGRAKKLIYAENQYFASRAVAEAISKRMAEPDPPEVLIIHPAHADGWIESTVMDPVRALLAQAVHEVDAQDRFHLYMPYMGETPIYVHAKLLIVDDEIIRIGSSNFNNRSMGLDTECDVFIDCARPANQGCSEAIRALRYSLLAEHCGLHDAEVGPLLEQAGSMVGLITALGEGRERHLKRFQPESLTDIQAALADSEAFDPESPDDMFSIGAPRRGLFRPGSLLARAMDRVKRKRRRK
ncbi:MAG: phospholipase D-like domain-containing protein [Croceibacterium sp.]